jgi:hypothetical protein
MENWDPICTKIYESWNKIKISKALKLKHIVHNNFCDVFYYTIIHHLLQS